MAFLLTTRRRRRTLQHIVNTKRALPEAILATTGVVGVKQREERLQRFANR